MVIERYWNGEHWSEWLGTWAHELRLGTWIITTCYISGVVNENLYRILMRATV